MARTAPDTQGRPSGRPFCRCGGGTGALFARTSFSLPRALLLSLAFSAALNKQESSPLQAGEQPPCAAHSPLRPALPACRIRARRFFAWPSIFCLAFLGFLAAVFAALLLPFAALPAACSVLFGVDLAAPAAKTPDFAVFAAAGLLLPSVFGCSLLLAPLSSAAAALLSPP